MHTRIWHRRLSCQWTKDTPSALAACAALRERIERIEFFLE